MVDQPTGYNLNPNAQELFQKRYKGEELTFHSLIARISRKIASMERSFESRRYYEDKFYYLMAVRPYLAAPTQTGIKFLPNTPTLMHAGRHDNQCLSACHVDSPQDNLQDIVRVGSAIPVIEASGGGIGFGLSELRPAGDKVGNREGACGPISVLKWYAQGGRVFTQGASRPGAHMAQLHVSHPDIMDFIHVKDECTDPSHPLANVNTSVQVTDKFMEAVRLSHSWFLVNPRNGNVTDARNARVIWDAICESAWKTGDPGIVFIDRVNDSQGNSKANPHLGPIHSSNPCGEEFLEDGNSCNLGSINLAMYLGKNKEILWGELRADIGTAVRFLDNVIDANWFPFDYQYKVNQETRRIGLGVMGWADLLALVGIKYGSDESLNLASEVMKFISDSANIASSHLGAEKGAVQGNGDWPYRNSSRTTVAPTGSISILAGCSSGIEPYFAKSWSRSALWNAEGTDFDVSMEEFPMPLRANPNMDTSILVTAHDLSWEHHVRMQAAFQKQTDNGISKTINMRNWITPKDIGDAYELAWKLGCKATSVYRDGSKVQILDAT